MTDPTPTKANVLLLDDDKFLADMYAMKFSSEGFNTHACLSVTDALGVLRGGFPADAILFDIVMPEHDGYFFLEALKNEKLAPKAVKIALTNQSDDSEKARALSLGADLYLVKASMIPSEVVNTVKAEITRHNSA